MTAEAGKGMTKMKNFMGNRKVQAMAAGTGIVGFIVGLAAIAGATTYNPTTALTGLASSATSSASPIMVAVVLALIPLLIVFMIVGWFFGLFGKRRPR